MLVRGLWPMLGVGRVMKWEKRLGCMQSRSFNMSCLRHMSLTQQLFFSGEILVAVLKAPVGLRTILLALSLVLGTQFSVEFSLNATAQTLVSKPSSVAPQPQIPAAVGLDTVGSAVQEEDGGKAQEEAELLAMEHVVFKFANENHPELKQLLNYLKRNRGDAYGRALQNINKQINRLSRIQDADPLRHEIELELWTIRSRKSLYAAQVIVQQQSVERLREQYESLRPSDDGKTAEQGTESDAKGDDSAAGNADGNNESPTEKARQRWVAATNGLQRTRERLSGAVVDELKVTRKKLELDRSRMIERLAALNKQINEFDFEDERRVERLVRAALNQIKPSLVTPAAPKKRKPPSTPDN